MFAWKRWLIILSVIFITLYTTKFVYDEYTGDFNLDNISHQLPHEKNWELPPTTPEQTTWLKSILNQPYYWLGHGHQVFAFQSEDAKYVLKIFKFKRLKNSANTSFFANLPFLKGYYENLENKRLRRLEKLFKGYKLAYESDQDNTGILFIHFDNRTTDLQQQVHVIDRLGFMHELNLDTLAFAIQEKGVKTKDVLKSLLDKGQVYLTNQHIDSLFNLYLNEYKKGIIDQDHNILENTGFVGNRPIRVDVGQLQYDENMKNPVTYKPDLIKIADKRINRWIGKKYPQYQDEIRSHMEEKLTQIFGEPFHFESHQVIKKNDLN
jgi:hypothetical protein